MRLLPVSVVVPATFVTLSAFAQAKFAPPEELTAGGQPFNKLLYPTPVLCDVDGDETRELILGDLIGNLWACEPQTEGDSLAWAATQNLQADGKPLKLKN